MNGVSDTHTIMASGMPPRNPLGVVSHVLKSPWASIQRTPPVPCAAARPPSPAPTMMAVCVMPPRLTLAAERGHLHIVALLAGHGELLDSYMPVYSTYAEEFLPSTVGEHVQEKGFRGDEHLRYMAEISSDRMQDLTHPRPAQDGRAVARQRL